MSNYPGLMKQSIELPSLSMEGALQEPATFLSCRENMRSRKFSVQ